MSYDVILIGVRFYLVRLFMILLEFINKIKGNLIYTISQKVLLRFFVILCLLINVNYHDCLLLRHTLTLSYLMSSFILTSIFIYIFLSKSTVMGQHLCSLNLRFTHLIFCINYFQASK